MPSTRPLGDTTDSSARWPLGAGDVTANLAWKLAAIISTSLVVGLLFLDILGMLIRPLGVLFAAVVVALTLAPVVDRLEQWLPRLGAVLVVYFGLLLILVGFALVIIPPIATQLSSIIQNFPEHYRDVQLWFARELGMSVSDDMDQLASVAGRAADYLLMLPAIIVATGVEFVVGFFVSLYWVHTMPKMKAFGLSLFPPDRQSDVDVLMQRVGERMGGYMRGVVITGVVVGVAAFIGLAILGIQYALLLALLAFLGEFFPNVGPILAGIPAVAIAFLESPGHALAVLIFYIVVQQLESYVLVPVVMMRTQAHIPPLVTTFAVFTGFMVGGVLWAILAIPLAGAILTISTDVIAPAIRRQTGARDPDDEEPPQSVPPADESPAAEDTKSE